MVAASQALGRAYDDALIAASGPWVFPRDRRMERVHEIYDQIEVLYAELNDLLDELMPRKKRHVRKKG